MCVMKVLVHFVLILIYLIVSIRQGEASECCGGLLISLPREQAAAFCKEMERLEGYPSWIIGIVEAGDRTARIIDKPRVLEVPSKDTEDDLW